MISELLADMRDRRNAPTPAVARAVRQAAGLSQQQIADALGVGRVSITRYEAGQRRPRGRLARKYAAIIRRLQAEVRKS